MITFLSHPLSQGNHILNLLFIFLGMLYTLHSTPPAQKPPHDLVRVQAMCMTSSLPHAFFLHDIFERITLHVCLQFILYCCMVSHRRRLYIFSLIFCWRVFKLFHFPLLIITLLRIAELLRRTVQPATPTVANQVPAAPLPLDYHCPAFYFCI